jgi:hypothetical protein
MRHQTRFGVIKPHFPTMFNSIPEGFDFPPNVATDRVVLPTLIQKIQGSNRGPETSQDFHGFPQSL